MSPRRRAPLDVAVSLIGPGLLCDRSLSRCALRETAGVVSWPARGRTRAAADNLSGGCQRRWLKFVPLPCGRMTFPASIVGNCRCLRAAEREKLSGVFITVTNETHVYLTSKVDKLHKEEGEVGGA